MKPLLQVLTVLLLALLTTGSAWATTLDDLFNGGSITVGDKLFDSWKQLYYGSSDGSQFDASNITVSDLNDGDDYGIRFTVANNEMAVTGDDIYAYKDLMFGFRVSVLDPTHLISGNTLEIGRPLGSELHSFNDDSKNLGTYIRETIGTAAGLGDLGMNEIEFSLLDDILTSYYPAPAAFAPQQELWVTNNMLVWAVDSTDIAYLYGFDQRFSQTPVAPVPEPSTFVLLGAGLAGLVVWRKKRS